MSWNNSVMRAEFEKNESRDLSLCLTQGMNEETVTKLYEADLEMFNGDRRFYERTQGLYVPAEDFEDDAQNPYLLKNMDRMAVEQEVDQEKMFWWLDEIENKEVYRAIKGMGPEKMMIIHFLVYEGYTQKKIAHMLGIAESTLSERIRRMFSVLAHLFEQSGEKNKR